jgi:ankyrin repeat protein
MVEYLLGAGAQVTAVEGARGWTVLHAACESGSVETVAAVVGAMGPGAITATDTAEGLALQPIHVASAATSGAVVTALLTKHGAEPHAHDAQGRTPLHVAGGHGRDACVKALLARGAKRGARDGTQPTGLLPYDHAVRADFPVTAALLATPAILNRAASAGDADRVTQLLRDGVAVNGRDEDDRGRTALICAMRNGHGHVASILLNAGADASAKDTDGLTALMHGACNGDPTAITTLMRFGKLRGTAKDSRGRTAVHHAAEHNHGAAISALVGFNTNHDLLLTADTAGQTPLHITAAHNSVSATRALLKLSKALPITARRQYVTAADSHGYTAHDVAVRAKHTDVAALLAPPYALHTAAAGGDVDRIDTLVAGGADVEAVYGMVSVKPHL